MLLTYSLMELSLTVVRGNQSLAQHRTHVTLKIEQYCQQYDVILRNNVSRRSIVPRRTMVRNYVSRRPIVSRRTMVRNYVRRDVDILRHTNKLPELVYKLVLSIPVWRILASFVRNELARYLALLYTENVFNFTLQTFFIMLLCSSIYGISFVQCMPAMLNIALALQAPKHFHYRVGWQNISWIHYNYFYLEV